MKSFVNDIRAFVKINCVHIFILFKFMIMKRFKKYSAKKKVSKKVWRVIKFTDNELILSIKNK